MYRKRTIKYVTGIECIQKMQLHIANKVSVQILSLNKLLFGLVLASIICPFYVISLQNHPNFQIKSVISLRGLKCQLSTTRTCFLAEVCDVPTAHGSVLDGEIQFVETVAVWSPDVKSLKHKSGYREANDNITGRIIAPQCCKYFTNGKPLESCYLMNYTLSRNTELNINTHAGRLGGGNHALCLSVTVGREIALGVKFKVLLTVNNVTQNA